MFNFYFTACLSSCEVASGKTSWCSIVQADTYCRHQENWSRRKRQKEKFNYIWQIHTILNTYFPHHLIYFIGSELVFCVHISQQVTASCTLLTFWQLPAPSCMSAQRLLCVRASVFVCHKHAQFYIQARRPSLHTFRDSTPRGAQRNTQRGKSNSSQF